MPNGVEAAGFQYTGMKLKSGRVLPACGEGPRFVQTEEPPEQYGSRGAFSLYTGQAVPSAAVIEDSAPEEEWSYAELAYLKQYLESRGLWEAGMDPKALLSLNRFESGRQYSEEVENAISDCLDDRGFEMAGRTGEDL